MKKVFGAMKAALGIRTTTASIWRWVMYHQI